MCGLIMEKGTSDEFVCIAIEIAYGENRKGFILNGENQIREWIHY